MLLFGIVLAGRSLQGLAVDTVVASFYPDRLTQLTVAERTLAQRYQAYEVTTFGEDGQSYVVAAYTNGVYGAVRVLKNTANGWVLAFEPAFDGFSGSYPEIELRDVTGDGVPEIFASFYGTRGTEYWIFQWQNHALNLISPSSLADGTRFTELTDVELLDIDGDGTPEVIDQKVAGRGDDARPSDTVYRWTGGHLALIGPLAYRGIFNRAKSDPENESAAFDVTTNSTRYQLIVVNGGFRGPTHRTSSADIRLNGVSVVAPSQFKQQDAVITVPVALRAENHISVRVAGEPGGQIVVIIMPAP